MPKSWARIVCVMVGVGLGVGCSNENPVIDALSSSLLSIESFEADRARVEWGEEVTVSWSVRNAKEILLLVNDEVVPLGGEAKGSLEIPIYENTVFRLEAKRADERTHRAIVVAVKDGDRAPVILSFSATPKEVDAGEAVTLSWLTHGATSLELLGPEGPIDLGSASPEAGEVTIVPGADGTYRLLASGEGVTEQTVFVRVRGRPAAEFDVVPKRASAGERVTLRWDVEEASRVWVREVGGDIIMESEVGMDGSIELVAERTTTFELHAEGPWRDVVVTVTLEVLPELLEFQVVEQGPLGVGNLATLAWKTRGATEVEVSNLAGDVEVITGYRVAEGTARLPVSEGGAFEIRARSAGEEAFASTNVEILAPPSIASFTVTPDFLSAQAQPVRVVVSWEGIENADEVQLVGSTIGRVGIFQPPFVDGSLELWLRESTELHLSARNAAGETVVQTVAVLVPLPVIDDFALFPRHAGVGETVQVSWDVSGASSVLLEFDGQPVPIDSTVTKGSVPFVATEQGTFRLVAINEADGSVDRSRALSLGSPEIRSFALPASTVLHGTPLPFQWVTLGGIQLTLKKDGSPIFQTVDPDEIEAGGFVVSGSQIGAATYTLELVNGIGETAVRSMTAVVTDGPVIEGFDVSKQKYCVNEAPTLSWSITDNPQGVSPTLYVEIDGVPLDVSSLDSNADSVVLPLLDAGIHQIQLSASTPGNLVDTRSFTVEVVDETLFTRVQISPEQPVANQDITLSWETICADGVEVQIGKVGAIPITPNFQSIASTGTFYDFSSACGWPDDEGCATISFPSGFTFPFDGVQRSSIRVFLNGLATFDLSYYGSTWMNSGGYPITSKTWATFAVFWTDLIAQYNVYPYGVRTQLTGAAPNRSFIIQWIDLGIFGDDNLNFQLVLHEDGTFEYRYGTMSSWWWQSFADGEFGVIGYQNSAGSDGHVISSFMPVAGGLSNKSYLFGYPKRQANGSYTFRVQSSQKVVLKATGLTGAEEIVEIELP